MSLLPHNFNIVPFRIRIGVTGHRTISDMARLNAAVEDILSIRYRAAFTLEAQNALDKASSTPVAFTVVSPLAEGSDRLVASAVLRHGGLLEALLPLPRVEYEKDFRTLESRLEFADLLSQAQRVAVTDCAVAIGDVDHRQKAYRLVGEETVNRCDFLIAIWDGKEPKDSCGTGGIVALALQKKKPLFILSTASPGAVDLKNGGILSADFVAELDTCNAIRLGQNA